MVCATFKYPIKSTFSEWVTDTVYLDVDRAPIKGEYVRLDPNGFRYEVSSVEWRKTDSGYAELHPIVFLSYVG